MKILIAASWLRLGGGVTRALLELLKRIDYNSYSVTLLLLELDKEVAPLIPAQVRIIEVKNSFQTENSAQILKDLIRHGKLLTALSYIINLVDFRITGDNYRHQGWITRHMEKQSEEYDIAIAYSMMNTIVNKYVIDNVRAKKRILWCHTDVRLYKEKYIKGLGKLYREYDRINCVSKTSLEALKEKFPFVADKLHVTYNFIDCEKIIAASKENPDIPVPDDKLKICTVSRISGEKGTDILIDTAHMLNIKNIDFVWWVIGTVYDDEFNRKIKAKIIEYGLDDKVLILGEKNPPFSCVARCDIYVQPSRFEGYCTTTNEAKILLRPIVTTCVSGSHEQFENGINGTITDISAEALFNAVYELACSEETRKKYTENLKSDIRLLQEASFDSMIS